MAMDGYGGGSFAPGPGGFAPGPGGFGQSPYGPGMDGFNFNEFRKQYMEKQTDKAADLLENGYKKVRTKYIAFVNEYNAAKKAGTINPELIPPEIEGLKKLQTMWRRQTFKKSDNFADMGQVNIRLGMRFLDPETSPVHKAWHAYADEGLVFRENVLKESKRQEEELMNSL